MKTKTKCPCCGRNSTPYQVPLTKGLMSALIKFTQAIQIMRINKIHLLKDMIYQCELTKHEWNNFSRLRFHGLVEKYKEEGEHIGGYWYLTKKGSEFVHKGLQIPDKVLVFNNKAIDQSEDLVSLKDVLGDSKLLVFETIDDIVYGTL